MSNVNIILSKKFYSPFFYVFHFFPVLILLCFYGFYFMTL